MPAKVETTPTLPGLSPVGGKPVIARFDGGQLSSDGGSLAWCMCGRPLERKGFCLIWLTERVRSCVRPSTRLHDRWPRWVSPNKPQTRMRHRDAFAPSGLRAPLIF